MKLSGKLNSGILVLDGLETPKLLQLSDKAFGDTLVQPIEDEADRLFVASPLPEFFDSDIYSFADPAVRKNIRLFRYLRSCHGFQNIPGVRILWSS